MFGASKSGKVDTAVTDPLFEYNTLLLNGDGTNGSQNNTILDSSTNNYSITRGGSATQGTFTPYGPNWSNYFGGSGSYLSFPANAGLAFGTGDFCVEFWLYWTGGANENNVIMNNASGGLNIKLSASNPNNWGLENSYVGQVADFGTAPTKNTWHHIAVTRSSGTLYAFVDGAQVFSGSNSTNFTNTAIWYIGANGYSPSAYYITGYLSNFRIVVGSAVYTSNFTPSTTPLTAIANTSLLTCQSNFFVDNSVNAFAVTLVGTPSVQRFSPFSPPVSYSTATYGGSALFQSGNLEFTRDSVQFGTGDLTLEFWVNPSSVSSTIYMFNRAWSGANFFMIDLTPTAQMELWFGHPASGWFTTVSTTSPAPFKANQWHHVALTRQGTSVKAFVNGVAIITATSAVDLSNGDTSPCYIGKYWFYPGILATGYISDFRAVAGTAVYTANFTPPTAPLTAISGTSLLLSGVNGGIYDSAMMNDLVTVGDAQVSTSVKKYGTGSMYFDGTGDYLSIPKNNAILDPVSGDFTYECWLYLVGNQRSSIIGSGSGGNVYTIWIDYNSTGTGKLGIWASSNGTSWNMINADPGGNGVGTTTLALSTWYHVAFTRSGNVFKLFLNGSTEVSTTVAGTIPASNSTWEIGRQGSYGFPLNGYIDDFRVTKGYARYTANFTPPTAAFPTS